jgi:hypothetical protein
MARFLRLEAIDDLMHDPATVARALGLAQELLTVGLPFGLPIEDAVRRFGVTRWFDFVDTFRLDGLEVLGLPPTDWFHNLGSTPGELAAGFYADLWLAADERESQALAVAGIESRLGPGADSSVSNTVSTTWTIGFLEITAYAFPCDLQSASINLLEDRHPELKTRTNVRIDSFIAEPRPDETLAVRHGRARFRLPLPAGTSPVSPSSQLRLHPSAVTGGPSSLGIEAPEVWADAAGLAVSTGRVTALLDEVVAPRLFLEELTPARGGGQSILEGRDADGRNLRLAWSGRWDELRPVAEELGRLLDVDVEVTQHPDE